MRIEEKSYHSFHLSIPIVWPHLFMIGYQKNEMVIGSFVQAIIISTGISKISLEKQQPLYYGACTGGKAKNSLSLLPYSVFCLHSFLQPKQCVGKIPLGQHCPFAKTRVLLVPPRRVQVS